MNGRRRWRRSLRRRRVYCKLSGLATEAKADWNVATLRPYAEHIIKSFGADRVMWGSDWPVVNLAGGYDSWRQAAEAIVPPADRDRIFGGTAAEFTGLRDPPANLLASRGGGGRPAQESLRVSISVDQEPRPALRGEGRVRGPSGMRALQGKEGPQKKTVTNRLSGKIALVTAAAQGIGEATARAFAAEGAHGHRHRHLRRTISTS